MTLPDDNQIHGVDDAEVGITDLSNGPGYPWSSQAADPQDQHVRNFTPVSHSADLVTGPSQSSETVGYVPSPQEQTRNVYAPAASFSGYLGILPPGIIQIQPRLPSLTDLGFSRASSENANAPYSGPSHRAMNDHSATPHFSLTGPSSLLPTNYRNEHRVSTSEDMSIQLPPPGSNTPFWTPHELATSRHNAASHQRSTHTSVKQEDKTLLSPKPALAKEQTVFTPICEFSQPCRMGPSPDGVHFRKVVSHLFGRNKASTKLFPESVWVFYCRKHYQRARYRAEQWPFNQCELLLQSLDRMERWGYVRSFELRLRRREAMRADGQADRPGPSGLLGSGRRHPTAFTAPVPNWLQQEVGSGKTFDDIRNIVERIRQDLANARQQKINNKQSKEETGDSVALSDENRHVSLSTAYRERQSFARFPDIEILPTFHPSVQAQRRPLNRRGNKTGGEEHSDSDPSEDRGFEPRSRRRQAPRPRGLNRVSARGAVRKPKPEGPADKQKFGKRK
ncbi:hypothetical protein POX_g08637 [Penicillium oxalicum]|uniref:hypothetical protein n=1 Tax=Penicillium oxalicum TaxID=69781 RepID=UPI0020B70528|nr:hypothetical protein POX_g08637 [Penicillium oxalicum]KAI2786254.1 hypothetical protein POX_g08637 [Penicillium oxalicum]